jgi:hypothetical protein
MTVNTPRRFLSSTSVLALLGGSMMAFYFGAASPAQANCTINGVSSSASVVDLVPEEGQVVCDTGVLVQGFNGRTDQQVTTPANQFDAEIRSGATLVAPGPGAQMRIPG